jgi:4a-hydroxytetrahydrobiopterin dehydratase
MTARPRALSPTEIVTRLAQLGAGWKLSGDGDATAIEKTFPFKNFHETMAFVNAVAYVAHGMDHHPDLSVHYGRCAVRYTTHDAKGITELDFEAAARIEALGR